MLNKQCAVTVLLQSTYLEFRKYLVITRKRSVHKMLLKVAKKFQGF